MMVLEQKIDKLTELHGTKLFKKVITDLINSKHTAKFLAEIRFRQIVPDGDSCVACVMSNWRYAMAGADKLEIGAHYILLLSLGELEKTGFIPGSHLVAEALDEIDSRISRLRI